MRGEYMVIRGHRAPTIELFKDIKNRREKK
jgi:hypothetical protein